MWMTDGSPEAQSDERHQGCDGSPEMMRSKMAMPARNVGKYPRTPSAT